MSGYELHSHQQLPNGKIRATYRRKGLFYGADPDLKTEDLTPESFREKFGIGVRKPRKPRAKA